MSVSIFQYFCGTMDNCQYIISDDETKKAAIVDPAWDVPFLIDSLNQHFLTLDMILLTHGHFDHTEGVGQCLGKYHVPVYMSKKELINLRPQGLSIQYTNDNQRIHCGNTEIICLHTPGHSPGGQCFYVGNHLISGDTLFVDGCGRCDLQGSDVDDMYSSLERIKELPDDTIICPGHHYGKQSTDTLKNQRIENRFLNCASKQEFVKKRMKTS